MIADSIVSLLSDQISINGVVFDAYLELNQVESVTVTSHPIQTGANVSDHAYVNPNEFDYLIGVTNSSIGKSLPLLRISLPIVGMDRTKEAYNLLEGWKESRQPVELHNKYGDYQVLITSFSILDDYKTNDCIKARVHLKEVIIASTVAVMSESDSYIKQENNMGQQPSSKQNESILYKRMGGTIF